MSGICSCHVNRSGGDHERKGLGQCSAQQSKNHARALATRPTIRTHVKKRAPQRHYYLFQNDRSLAVVKGKIADHYDP